MKRQLAIEGGCCCSGRQIVLTGTSMRHSVMKGKATGSNITSGLSTSTFSAPKMSLLTVLGLLFVLAAVIGDSARLAEAAAASSRSGESIEY